MSTPEQRCPMGPGCGGYWARNTRTGEMRAVPCAGCGKPPKGVKR